VTEGLDSERLAVLVHEVRSPVAALSAIAETFGEPELDSRARHELVRLSLAACRGIERIVTDLAVASIHIELVDPEALVRDAVSAAALGGAHIEVDVTSDLPWIEGDPSRLRQVLDNLISNAVTHGPPAGVVVVRAEADDRLRISVTDTGDGVPVEEQDRIFDVGIRLDRDTAGSGLGLPLSRAIAEEHGGSLTVASDTGGTTFTVTLPLPRR
jgi:signal transduction histidine kinase